MDASWFCCSFAESELAGGKEQAIWGATCSSPFLPFTDCRMRLDQHICPGIFWSYFTAKLLPPSFSQTQNDAGSAELAQHGISSLCDRAGSCSVSSACTGQAKLTGGIIALKCTMWVSQQEALSHIGITSVCLVLYCCLHAGKHPCHWADYLANFLETACGISLERRSVGFQL